MSPVVDLHIQSKAYLRKDVRMVCGSKARHWTKEIVIPFRDFMIWLHTPHDDLSSQCLGFIALASKGHKLVDVASQAMDLVFLSMSLVAILCSKSY